MVEEISPALEELLYLPITLLFELTVGVEELANLVIYLSDVYQIVQNSNVSNEKKGELAGLVFRDIVVDVLLEIYFYIRHHDDPDASRSKLRKLWRKISY